MLSRALDVPVDFFFDIDDFEIKLKKDNTVVLPSNSSGQKERLDYIIENINSLDNKKIDVIYSIVSNFLNS